MRFVQSGLILFFLLFGGCAGYLESGRGVGLESHLVKQMEPEIQGPDPGAGAPYQTLHFKIEGYGSYPGSKTQVVEKIFSEVTNQTALYSFKPKENYRVVIYKSKEEYQNKTGMPEWSGGMKTGRGVFTYEHGGVDVVLAHEITHIIFGEFLENEEKNFRWLSEGLAQYLDAQFHPYKTLADHKEEWETGIKKETRLTIQKILEFNPFEASTPEVDLWYKTTASLTGFLIENGGSFSFSVFLKGLKEGYEGERALKEAYPGKFQSFAQLYEIWKGTL